MPDFIFVLKTPKLPNINRTASDAVRAGKLNGFVTTICEL